MRPYTFLLYLLYIPRLWSQCDFSVQITASSVLLCPGTEVTMHVPDTFDSYQWYMDEELLAGATEAGLTLSFYDAAGSRFSVKLTKDECSEQTPQLLVDGYAFLPIYLVLTGGFGFDPDSEQFVLCDETQYGGPDTLVLHIGGGYDTLIAWYRDGELLPEQSGSLAITTEGTYIAVAAPSVCPNFLQQTLPTSVRIGQAAEVYVAEDQGVLYARSDMALSYIQWYKDDELIPDANTDTYTPTASGEYAFYAENFYCRSFSDTFSFVVSSVPGAGQDLSGQIWPLPCADILHVSIAGAQQPELRLHSIDGRVAGVSVTATAATGLYTLDMSGVAAGAYILQIFGEGRSESHLILKQ